MDVLFMIIQIILGLSIIVVIHEFGHYIAARSFGMYVEKFFLFFDAGGRKLFSLTRGGTEYGIGWLPLGGYVKISGMIDESMDTEQMKQEPQPWEFRSKPAWQRFIVMVAGVVLNFILGVLIFTGITFGYGESYTPIEKLDQGIMAMELGQEAGFKDGDVPVKVNGQSIEAFGDLFGRRMLQDNFRITVRRDGKDTTIEVPSNIGNRIAEAGQSAFMVPRDTFYVQRVKPGSPADEAGLQKKDRILSIDGEPAFYFKQLKAVLKEHKGEEVAMTIGRDGQKIEETVEVKENGKLGFYPNLNVATKVRYYSLPQSVDRGFDRAYNALATNLIGFGKLLTGGLDPQKSMQGPIGIATIYGGDIQWARFWEITGLLSLVIGLVNILPIPALDGGHATLLTYEMIVRRPIPDNVYKVIQTIGVVLILSLMAFVIFNDIAKLVF